MNQTRTLAILIFDDVEVLDFCGPYGRNGEGYLGQVFPARRRLSAGRNRRKRLSGGRFVRNWPAASG